MRLLHTSDWHLGQALHQFDRSYEREQFLSWLLYTLVAEHVDVVRFFNSGSIDNSISLAN